MPSGLLGFNDLAASTNTSVYTVPVSTTASFSVNFTNRNSTAVAIRLGICATGTPANGEFIIFNTIVEGNSSLERTGLVAEAGKIIVAFSNTANVSVQVYGYEA